MHDGSPASANRSIRVRLRSGHVSNIEVGWERPGVGARHDGGPMHKQLIFVTALISATGAMAQTTTVGDEHVADVRLQFDALYKNLPHALDNAIVKLDAVPANSSGPEWAAAKIAVSRENTIWLALGEMLRDTAERARANTRPGAVDNPYLDESVRESRLFVPMTQREVLLAHLLIAKHPSAEQGRPTRLAGGGSVTFNPGDYPAYAMRMHHEGRTSFRLAVGPDGRAVSCTVTTSSGYLELDDATCRLMNARARFTAGRSRSYFGSVNWRIPSSQAPATVAQSYAAQEVPIEKTPAYQLGKAQAAAALGPTPER